MFLLIALPLFCWLLVHRLLKVTCPLLCVGFTITLGAVWMLSLANVGLATNLAALPLGLACAYLWKKCPASAFEAPALSKPAGYALVGIWVVVLTYTCANQNLFLDDDFWIHYALMGLLKSDGLPVRHPFFAEILMRGHYGRDLLIATMSRLSGVSLFQAQFTHQLLAQLGSLLCLSGLAWRSTRSDLSTVLAVLFTFVGVNVGSRGGLMECYQNNNGLAYMVTLGLFGLLYLVVEEATPARVVVAGLALGPFALIYETHFGLIGLVMLVYLVATRRKEFVAIGLIALTIAAVQGGPITNMVRDRLHPVHRQWTPGELNQHQIVKFTFPKKELFQVQLAYGFYQRRSCAYSLLPPLGPITQVAPGTPYRPLWSWDLLMIHWLPTLLAPFSLWMLARRPANQLGLGFWVFAAASYLVPGLVNFGPIYEFEYFRWEFATGFAFAVAFGLAAGRFLEKLGPALKWSLLTALVVLEVSPSLVLFVAPTVEAVHQKGSVADFFRPRKQLAYVMGLSQELRGFCFQDYKAARLLSQISQPGDNLIVNAPCRIPHDIRLESTLAGISGRRSVGHSLPWPQEPVGTPPFHRSAPAVAFWGHPSEALLAQLSVDWVLMRPGADNQAELIDWFDAHCQVKWAEGNYRLWRSPVPHRPLVGVSSQPSRADPPRFKTVPDSVYTATPFEFSLEPSTGLWAWGFVKAGDGPESLDLHEVVCWTDGPCLAVTPPISGTFELRLFEVRDGWLYPTERAFPIEVKARAFVVR
ncbi:MAG: hypothetical protein KC910_05360 [Candidatus Eremiobacteraeota bacterium]|nr:hypothetical protein [Candidatus Eremiobacteraeota bacterium]